MAHHFREFQLNWQPLSFRLAWRSAWIKRSTWGRNGISVFLIALPLGLLPDMSWEVVAGQRLSLNAIPWETQFERASAQETPGNRDAESLLREAHRLLSSGQRAEALSIAQELVVRYPNFQLGQLLFADLLNLTSDQPIDVRSALNLDGSGLTQQRLQQLNDEARQRLTRPESAVYAGKEPEGLLYLSAKVPFAVVVDASHSRLYLMGHASPAEAGGPSQGLQVIFESYMSVGQHGIGKQHRGDGKTPLGAYVVQKSYPGHVLPDLYGSGALTLNYPNDVDILDGKTGSGIWIHGSPSDQYARAPESTDGCVVLSNPDMDALLKFQLPAGTPVFILPHIEWVSPQKNKNLRAQMRASGRDGAVHEQNEALAVLSWQAQGRKLIAMVSAVETSAMGKTSALTPSYWIEQEHQWRAVSVNSGDDLLTHRLSVAAKQSLRTVVR